MIEVGIVTAILLAILLQLAAIRSATKTGRLFGGGIIETRKVKDPSSFQFHLRLMYFCLAISGGGLILAVGNLFR